MARRAHTVPALTFRGSILLLGAGIISGVASDSARKLLGDFMAKYKVLVQFEMNGENGSDTFPVEANSVHITTEWVTFENGMSGKANSVVALFPRERVISVVLDETASE